MVRRTFLKLLAGVSALFAQEAPAERIPTQQFKDRVRRSIQKYYVEVDAHAFFYRGAGLPIQLRYAAKCIYCTTTGEWIKSDFDRNPLTLKVDAPEVDREWLVTNGYVT